MVESFMDLNINSSTMYENNEQYPLNIMNSVIPLELTKGYMSSWGRAEGVHQTNKHDTLKSGEICTVIVLF